MLPENRKKIRMVYIAGPIDGISREAAQNWRTEAYDTLAQMGIVSAVPGLEKTKMKSGQIVRLDENMIHSADAILVNLTYLANPPTKWMGTGTLVELGMGLAYRKLIIAFTEGGELDENFLFLRGTYDHYFSSMKEALEKIREINEPYV